MKKLFSLILLASAITAGAQSFGRLGTITNLPLCIATASTNFTSGAIIVRPGVGLSMWPLIGATNNWTTNRIWFAIHGTPDGTNWSTSPVLEMWAYPPTSTGGVLRGTNFAPALIDNFYKLRIQQITNANYNGTSNSPFVTNITTFYHY